MTPYQSTQTQSNSQQYPETQAVKPVDAYDSNTSKVLSIYDQNRYFFIFLLCIILTISNVMETGTLVGFLLPMDGILFAATLFLVGQGEWGMLGVIFVVCIIATCVGDFLGYYTGYKLGGKLYDKPDTWFFKKKYLLEGQEYFKKYGEKVFYIGRFISIGNIIPTLLGAFKMDLISFLIHSFLSAVLRVTVVMIPTALIGLLWPAATSNWTIIGGMTLVIYTLPEIAAWLLLLQEPAKQYFDRLKLAQDELSQIKDSFGDIVDNTKAIFDKVAHGNEHSNLQNNETPTEGTQTNPIQTTTQVISETTQAENLTK